MTPAALLQSLAQAATTWGPFLLLVLASALVAWLAERFAIRALRRATRSTSTELDDLIVRAVHPALVAAIFVAGVWFGVRYLRTDLPPGFVLWADRLSLALVVFLAALVTSRLAQGLLRYRAARAPRWMPVASLASRVLYVLIYLIAFLVVLDSYGLSITPLLTSLGLAGLAVALALQDTLTNFFAGLWIQTGRHLRVGHFVRVEDAAVEGYVAEIGWRTTKIRTLPNNLVILPNAKLAQSVVTDYHLPEPRMSLLVPISVGYEFDPDRVERILVEEALAAAESTPGLLKDPRPFVRFIPGFGEYALQFTLICQVREFVDQYLAQHEIRKRILARFRREGIRIPYPVRENVHVPPQRPDVAGSAA